MCKNEKTTSVKWRRYSFGKVMNPNTFSFGYSLSGYNYNYRITFKLVEGNDENAFEIRQYSPTRMKILNPRKLVGPKIVKLVLHTDVNDRENNLVDRFIYELYFYLSKYDV